MTGPVEFGIRIKIDGGQPAVNTIDKITDATARAGSTASTASRNLSTSQKELKTATEQLTLGQVKFLESLRDQSTAAGLSRTELLKLQAAELGVSEAARNHIQQIEAAAAAQHKFSLATAGTSRELMVLSHEAVTGNFSRLGGSMMVLANQAGLAQVAFSGTGLAVIGATAAVAGFVIAAAKGHEEMVAMNNALAVTSNYSGMTRTSMDALAESMTKTKELTVGHAREIVTELVASGRIGQQAIAQVAHLASDLAKSTGQDIDKIAPELIKLFSDPAKGADELNKSMHFLTVTDLEHIATLERLGQVQEAQRVLAEKLTDHLPKQVENLTQAAKAWNSVADGISRVKESIKNFGKIASAQEQINALEERKQSIVDNFNRAAGGLSREKALERRKEALAEVAALQQVIDSLQGAANAENKAAAASADTAKANQLQVQSWDAVKKSSQLYHAQELQDQLKLIQQNKPENDTQLAAKLDAERRVAKEIDDLYRSMGAEGRQLAQQQAAADERLAQTRLKGEAEQIQAELALGKINKEQFDIKMTNVQLEENAAKQAYERQMLRIGGLTKTEQQNHRNMLREQQAQWDVIEQHGVNQQLIDEKKAYDDIVKSVVSVGTAESKRLDDAIKAQREHNAEIGQTAAQKEMVRRAIQEETIAQLQSDAAYLQTMLDTTQLDEKSRAVYEMRLQQINEEITKRRALATLMSDGSVLEANAAAARQAAEEWKKTANTIEHSLYDAIANGGQAAVRRLKEYFAKLVLQPIIAPIAGGLASIMYPGAAQAQAAGPLGGTNTLSLISAGKSLWEGFSSGFSGLQSTITGYAQSGINLFGVNTGSYAGIGAPGPSALAQGIGTTGAYLGGIAGGYSIGNLISGEYGSKFVTAAGTAAGAYIGAQIGSIGGPLGAIIGGAVGGLFNRAFGMGDKETQRFGIEGDFASNGFIGRNYSDWHQDGGWFRGDDNGTDYSSLDPAMVGMFSSSVDVLKKQTADMAKSLGLSAASIEDYSKHIRLQLTNDQAQNQKIITDLFTSIGEELTAKAGNFSAFAKAGEASSVTLQRLSISLTTANSWLSTLGKHLFQVSLAGADSASKLADAFGGLDNLANASAAFYATYYSDGERAARSTADMTKALAAVNLSMPKTKAQLREMAASLDLNTESGRQAYAVLLSIAPAFANVAEYTSRSAQETAAKLVSAFSADGALVPVLNTASASIKSLVTDMATTGSNVGYISRLFLNLRSGLISFNLAAGATPPILTDAQRTALLLNSQIDTLRYNAHNVTIDFNGLGTAMANMNTSVFVETIATAFENLADRIKAVLGNIADERGAVREDALKILNPTVMSKAAIQSGIASINTALPSNVGVLTALNSLDAANRQQAVLDAKKASIVATYAPIVDSNKALYEQSRTSAQSNLNVFKSLLSSYSKDSNYQETAENFDAGVKFRARGYYTVGSQTAQNNSTYAAYVKAFDTAQSALAKYNQYSAVYNQKLAEIATQQAAITNTVNAATAQAKQAQIAYADALQNFAIDASKSVSKLSRLREETVKWYESQKQLADLMQSSAAGLRKTVDDYKYSQLTPQQQFDQLQTQFSTAYAMALSTDGETLAGYGNQLNSLLNPLLEKAREVYGSDSAYNVFASTAIARAEAIANRLDQLTPTNYAADSLAMLGQIDSTLAALDNSSRSAEKMIVDAINASRDQTVGGLRAVVAALTGKSVPAFALGGDHFGGYRIVGENGPELEATGPSRIFNASQTRAILSRGDSSDGMEALVQALLADNSNMRAELRAIAVNTGKVARFFNRVEKDGMQVYTEADTPLQTEAV